MQITSLSMMVQEVQKYPGITAEQLSASLSCELRALATPDHLLKLSSTEIILHVLTLLNVQLPAVKKLMGIPNS
jgi:hypothetical protein